MANPNLKPYYFILLAIAFVGFMDSIYLTTIHYMEQVPGCGEDGGCGEVAASEYSTILGIPISIGGIGYYVTIIFLSIWWIDKANSLVPKVMLILSVPAFLFSIWLVHLQLNVIDAICFYCMVSAGSSTLIFLISFLVYRKASIG